MIRTPILPREALTNISKIVVNRGYLWVGGKKETTAINNLSVDIGGISIDKLGKDIYFYLKTSERNKEPSLVSFLNKL